MSVPATGMSLKMSVPSFLLPIEAMLDRVEERLSAELESRVGTAYAVSNHILGAGGKRLRPSLVGLSARACAGECDAERLANVAAAVELIHMASLAHDDVIDAADLRRGRVSANACWGNRVPVLTGDYMLAKAFSLLAREGDIRIMRILAGATIAMTEGEIRQIESRGDTQARTASYLSIVHDKTAAFTSACCRIGAMVSSAYTAVEDSLAEYGLNFGFAFQITDDLLDLIGDPAEMGKPVGGDIRDGKVTMPLILTLEKANPSNRAAVENILDGDEVTSADIEFVRKLAECCGAVDATREAAAGYIGQAVEHLHALPPSEARDCLAELASCTLRRKS